MGTSKEVLIVLLRLGDHFGGMAGPLKIIRDLRKLYFRDWLEKDNYDTFFRGRDRMREREREKGKRKERRGRKGRGGEQRAEVRREERRGDKKRGRRGGEEREEISLR